MIGATISQLKGHHSLRTGRTTPSTDKIIDYRELIIRSTDGFIGPQWVFGQIDDWLAHEVTHHLHDRVGRA